MKRCCHCKTDRPLSDFCKDSHQKDGLSQKCSDCRRAYRPTRAAEAAYRRNRRRARPEVVARERAQCRKYHAKHRTQRIAQMRNWRRHNPEKMRQSVEHWRSANRQTVRDLVRLRSHRVRVSAGSFTQEEWSALCGTYNNCCAYCRRPRKLTVHHVIPVSRGGDSFITNIAPACQSCNSRIGTKIVQPPAPVGVGVC